ncbi:hypothetical protein [Pseudomonas arsenicoxydans]|uniref:Uncharacterized protein n=1 Tax=Pseudomonas arsenicoxydans TaxID=702115 RepID=A0A502HW63_9PSED|nr:hypothetical protein [Pseudomonas arsenicoxydans]TPG77360.1 hypothetical protein EAH78_14275 [Pseudomonas arsenicoxydans]
MRKPYGLTDDDLNDLERVRDSIALVCALAHQANDPGMYRPQMLAAFLDGISGDLNRVIRSATTTQTRI